MKKVLFIALTFMLSAVSLMASDTFTVYNKSGSKLTQLFAKEAGTSQWRPFTIGGGIAPGKSVTIQWAASTDGAACEWSFKAKFADGTESEPLTQDTCSDHDIEFTDG